MKRLLILAMVFLSTISCVKREVEPTYVTVKFGYADYHRGSLTKVSSDNTQAIKDMIVKSLPTEFPLDLCYSKTNSHFSTEVGKELSIPVGRYTISGENEVTSTISLSSTCSMSSVPQMKVYESMDINTSRSQYPLTAKFECFAIVVDFREVDIVNTASGQIPFMRDGNYGIIFVKGMTSNFSITVFPKDLTFNESKNFTFSTKNNPDVVFVQNGYYYFVHPNAVETQGLSFTLNYEEMNGIDVK